MLLPYNIQPQSVGQNANHDGEHIIKYERKLQKERHGDQSCEKGVT